MATAAAATSTHEQYAMPQYAPHAAAATAAAAGAAAAHAAAAHAAATNVVDGASIHTHPHENICGCHHSKQPWWDANHAQPSSGNWCEQPWQLGYAKGKPSYESDDRDRDPPPKWSGRNPGSELKPWLTSLKLWRHGTTIPQDKWGSKLLRTLEVGTVTRTIAEAIPVDVICTPMGFDLIVEAITRNFQSYLDVEPEVQCELTIYKSKRDSKLTFVEYVTTMTRKMS